MCHCICHCISHRYMSWSTTSTDVHTTGHEPRSWTYVIAYVILYVIIYVILYVIAYVILYIIVYVILCIIAYVIVYIMTYVIVYVMTYVIDYIIIYVIVYVISNYLEWNSNTSLIQYVFYITCLCMSSSLTIMSFYTKKNLNLLT